MTMKYVKVLILVEVVNLIFHICNARPCLKYGDGNIIKEKNICFIFDLSNPLVHTLRKSVTPISPPKRTLYEEILIIF